MKTPITKQGADILYQELERLKRMERPKVIRAISEARGYGDLRENAEYLAAKEQQAFVEGRIAELEEKLASVRVIDIKTLSPSDKVTFGATVHLQNIDNNETVHYQIVGEDEADIKRCRISVSSPIARAIINKKKGDTVTVVAPKGEIEYLIKEIAYLE